LIAGIVVLRMTKRSKNEDDRKRDSLEVINGIYIPKNLEECFQELDKLLSEETKSRLKTLEGNQKLSGHLFGAGLWMRNNWGLWQGSRLELYFKHRGIYHPDDMSGIISFFYLDWLKNIHTHWKDWEKHPKSYIYIL
jgi:hypothetical protein